MCFSTTDISQMEVWISLPVVTNLPELQDLLQFDGYAFNSDLSGSAGYIGDWLLLNIPKTEERDISLHAFWGGENPFPSTLWVVRRVELNTSEATINEYFSKEG